MSRPEYWLEEGELPGMLNWSLEGLERLKTQGGLKPPSGSIERAERQRRLSDPTHDFLVSRLELDPCAVTPRDPVYREYETWMKGTNSQKDLKSKQEFYAAVREQFPDVAERQVATDNGCRWCWVGLRRVN
jgi:putative DNA primase/helicase